MSGTSNPRLNRLSSPKFPEVRSTSTNARQSPAPLLLSATVNRNTGPNGRRTSCSPIKERPKKMSPRNKDKGISLKTQTLFTIGKSIKEEETAKGEAKGILSKAETDKFSPYVGAKRESEGRKDIFISTLSNYYNFMNLIISERIDFTKTKVHASTPDNAVLKTLTNSKDADYFTFVLGKGNNDRAVRMVMSKRYWWKETYAANTVYNFCWHQTNKPINFTNLIVGKTNKRVANHFEFNREIGVKSNLLKNLQYYCERNSLDLFKITPITFSLDLSSSQFPADMKTFKKYFNDFSKSHAEPKSSTAILDKNSSAKPKTVQEIPEVVGVQSSSKVNDTYYNGCNLWLLKPTDCNRGRGINLFNKISTLEHYLKCFKNGEDHQPNQKAGSSSPITSPVLNKTEESSMSIVKSHKFVVQKYIEKPLLIKGRKFDVRVWVLIDQDMNLYYFKEGYIRLSSEVFSLDEKTIEDKYVHLTNNAVQKYSKNYGKHESGNIIALKELEGYLPGSNPNLAYTKIIEKMKELIRLSMESVKNKLNAAERKQCFEVFGYDFILDSECNVWIIEVNSNPSIDESNGLLRAIVPRMLDDTFKLTLDKIFVPTQKNYKPEDTIKEEASLEFRVNGYSNDENLWEYISCLRRIQVARKEK